MIKDNVLIIREIELMKSYENKRKIILSFLKCLSFFVNIIDSSYINLNII